jgi:Tricorn protease C1 domain
LIGEDWDSVLAEFLPRLVAATTRDQYRLAMMALIARVRDSHANLYFADDLRPPRGSRALPVVVRFIEGVPVVTGIFYPDGQQSGLERGDILLAVQYLGARAIGKGAGLKWE